MRFVVEACARLEHDAFASEPRPGRARKGLRRVNAARLPVARCGVAVADASGDASSTKAGARRSERPRSCRAVRARPGPRLWTNRSQAVFTPHRARGALPLATTSGRVRCSSASTTAAHAAALRRAQPGPRPRAPGSALRRRSARTRRAGGADCAVSSSGDSRRQTDDARAPRRITPPARAVDPAAGGRTVALAAPVAHAHLLAPSLPELHKRDGGTLRRALETSTFRPTGAHLAPILPDWRARTGDEGPRATTPRPSSAASRSTAASRGCTATPACATST